MSVHVAVAALFTASLAFGQLPRPGDNAPPRNTSGIAPRSQPSDYKKFETAPGVTVGAVVLTPAQIKKIFPINLDSKGYIVVEVGIFPTAGQVTVDTDQFRLQVGDDRTMRKPMEPGDMVANPQSKTHNPPTLPGNLPVSTTATIGYESGGPYNRGGVYTGASTTVGSPGSQPYPYPDPRTMPQGGKDTYQIEQELLDMELAAGKTNTPVAGYLYFPKPRAKQKNPTYDLTYRGAGATIHLELR